MSNPLTSGSNARWTSMRLMLPEHIEALKQMKIDEQKISRPELCEDALIEIEKRLKYAIRNKRRVDMAYFKSGWIKQCICQPAKLDPINKQLIYRDAYGFKTRIDFSDIMSVDMSQD